MGLSILNVGPIGEVVFDSGDEGGDLGITLIDCTGCSLPLYVTAAGPLWTGDPYHPTFLPGIYKSNLQTPNYIEYGRRTPEPSTFALLGTGAVGLLGLAKRKFSR